MLNKPKQPSILILSGPSGAGKTTLANALVAGNPDTIIAVSHTTRAPRPAEKDGVDYYFVSKPEFHKLIDSEAMLEHAEVYDNLYGTSLSTVEQAMRSGKNIILDIDWQGARRIKAIYPDAISVFILPPAGKEAENRLLSRQQDSAETIQSRMSVYRQQISHQDEYDYRLINDSLEETVKQLAAILRPLE